MVCQSLGISHSSHLFGVPVKGIDILQMKILRLKLLQVLSAKYLFIIELCNFIIVNRSN